MNRTFNILLVDDDVTIISALSRILAGIGQLRFATNGLDALRLARESPPDLMLLDVEMPEMSGLEVCAQMKRDPSLLDVPVIFITSFSNTEQEVTGFNAGAVDFIGKPPSAPLVMARVRTHLRLKQMADALRKAAATDVLTGVANRRSFDEVLTREMSRAQRSSAPLSLLLIDIDCFKAYNDHYGHQGGDHCLTAVAQAIGEVPKRPGDLVARYGGEEFAVLLPETPAVGARSVAMRILASVDGLRLQHAASGVASHVTLSIGVSVYCRSTQTQEFKLNHTIKESLSAALIAAADQALYAAKDQGRRQARFLSIEDLGSPQRATAVVEGNIESNLTGSG